MVKLILTLKGRDQYDDETIEYASRISGLVCCNGSSIRPTNPHHHKWILTFGDRTDLTPAEITTFVRNFLDEGFEDMIEIKN